MGRWLDLARELQSDKIGADNSDKRDNSEADGPHRRFVGAFVPIVTNVTEVDVVNWINANPPSLPRIQNHCAACGEYIHVYDQYWVILGDGALIHHGGHRRITCSRLWSAKRRQDARAHLMNH